MYYNGQVVYDLDNRRPVVVGDCSDSTWAWTNAGNTTHFLEKNPKYDALPKVPKFADGLPQYLDIDGHAYRYTDWQREQEYSIALPKTVEEAEELMGKGLIFPAPVRP